MYEYDYEDFCEPSEADVLLNEYEEKMKCILLSNVKNTIDNFEAENKRLIIENAEMKQKINGISARERKIESEKNNMERKVKHQRLSSLMGDLSLVLYKASTYTEKKHKCDNCNANRKIEFESPTGKKCLEGCECSVGIVKYKPLEYHCSEFKINRDNNSMLMWFKVHEERDYDYYSNDSNLVKEVYESGIDYEKINTCRVYFRTIEECQKYCDWFNEKNN